MHKNNYRLTNFILLRDRLALYIIPVAAEILFLIYIFLKEDFIKKLTNHNTKKYNYITHNINVICSFKFNFESIIVPRYLQ